ncbi:MAG TPA: SCO family protein [Opitutaceae bacterium]|jgi:protein SCO1/2|nr:SCO family protein [Opitutaceae bacterium]
MNILRSPLLLLGLAASAVPLPGAAPAGNLFPGVGFEQRIGENLPMDSRLRNERGQSVRFGALFGGKPAVLIFGYTRCPQLCSIVADATVQALRGIKMEAGTDYRVIYVSIDPTDGPLEMSALKRRDLAEYGRAANEDGWNYLSGDERTVRALARAAGFFYAYDSRQKLYDHAAGFIVVTPEGQLSRYFLGVEFSSGDLLHALERAGEGKTGNSVFELILLCARGLGVAGKYGKLIWDVMEVAVVLTALIVFGGVGWMLWCERRSQAKGAGS